MTAWLGVRILKFPHVYIANVCLICTSLTAIHNPNALGKSTEGTSTSQAPRPMAGGFSDYSDLASVQATVDTINADIISLLTSEDLTVENDAEISVVSAQSQVVAGTNYRVTLNVGSRQNVVIQYFVALPYANPDQLPSNIQLIDAGSSSTSSSIGSVGSYSEVSDLDTVQSLVDSVDVDIKQLLTSQGVAVGDSDSITVTSAESQVVAGTNYRQQMTLRLPCHPFCSKYSATAMIYCFSISIHSKTVSHYIVQFPLLIYECS